MKMKNVILTIKSWNVENARKLKLEDKENEWSIFTEHSPETYKKIESINPNYIFVPHWSWIIPESIWKNYDTVVFHPTDLPYGRGGTPIQNLIIRGIYKTKLSALKVNGQIDAGPIYLKKDFDMSEGNIDKILRRASKIYFEEMIPEIINNRISPRPQEGEVVIYKRRKPEDSDLNSILKEKKSDPRKIYDFIRMLDGEGYPRAYLNLGDKRIEFYDARLLEYKVSSEVVIK